MHRSAASFALVTVLLSGCAVRPPSAEHEITANAPLQMKDAEYQAITRRILTRVAALKNVYPALKNIHEPQIADDGLATLEFDHGVTWVLDDLTKPASKLNARRENFDKNGFWIRLHFYRGTWKGATMFVPTQFGDLNLWFSYGYRPGDDPSIITAVSRIIDEEKKTFDAERAR